mmetsp:Transcript_80936/g.194096  ORF Transcript_80936/g.194096 Transcript_80936/m.194096 type:complete len:208 (+) Transcript_80936:226-849(+)
MVRCLSAPDEARKTRRNAAIILLSGEGIEPVRELMGQLSLQTLAQLVNMGRRCCVFGAGSAHSLDHARDLDNGSFHHGCGARSPARSPLPGGSIGASALQRGFLGVFADAGRRGARAEATFRSDSSDSGSVVGIHLRSTAAVAKRLLELALVLLRCLPSWVSSGRMGWRLPRRLRPPLAFNAHALQQALDATSPRRWHRSSMGSTGH